MKYILTILVSLAMMPLSWANWSKDEKIKTTTIEFSKGSHTLTTAQKESIKEMLVRLPDNGKKMTVGVAAWSDQPFPEGEQDLSSDQQKLASQRSVAVKKYIDEVRFKGSVETYNMAERSNWLARLFNTDSSEMKSMFSKQSHNKSLLKEKYKTYKENGAAQKAVLVLSRDM